MILNFLLTLTLITGTPKKAVASPATAVEPKQSASALFQLTQVDLNDSLMVLYNTIDLAQQGLSFEAFHHGMIGYYNLRHDGKLNEKNILTIIDFTKPSTEKRFYTIDLDLRQLIHHTYVSHGKNSGDNFAQRFSNIVHSNQSSIGFYVTAETYVGTKGFSLKLDGEESGYNDHMRERAVVMHEADYVSETWIRKYGRLGRSQGCPALPKELSKKIITDIKNGTAVFAYYNDEQYLANSSYLDAESLIAKLEAEKWQQTFSDSGLADGSVQNLETVISAESLITKLQLEKLDVAAPSSIHTLSATRY